MSEELVLWHDFNVALVTAAAGLLGLLFVALSIHIRALTDQRNAELRSVARSIFLGYVVSLGFGFLALMPQTLEALGLELLALDVAASIPFAAAARSGLRATGVGFDRRVTMVQFLAGFGLFAIAIASAIGVALGQPSALYVAAGIAIVALLWGVFNTWELIFRMQNVGGQSA
jgi:FtsH-binding integral membrane protein